MRKFLIVAAGLALAAAVVVAVRRVAAAKSEEPALPVDVELDV